MFCKQHDLIVSDQELAVIEAALHTQSKILDVQASAGSTAARSRLNEVKKVLASLAQQKPTEQNPRRRWRGFPWVGRARLSG
ncbi:hypothetical protein OS190_05925 [Sulfitobacter sp. F26204]|uniref:hypothetical protein n=1 Tax=Sulfitobacter sp. F26204 TaxID=2996014 RepID=UPI00225E4836|nr:hypothetical protein [Sulfitobacter sp. F26204]MCX7559099.1 hypothetical protein [Sulfitobacter sp. F26204]